MEHPAVQFANKNRCSTLTFALEPVPEQRAVVSLSGTRDRAIQAQFAGIAPNASAFSCARCTLGLRGTICIKMS